MLKFFSKNRLAQLLGILFTLWGVTIMSLYFYYYPSYRIALLWSLQIILALAILLVLLGNIFFVITSFFRLFSASVNKKLIFEKIRLILRREAIAIPLMFLPGFFYFCSLLWISYFFKRSHDLTIVATDTGTIIILTTLLIIAFSLGYRLLKLFAFSFSNELEKFLLSEAIGFGVLMFVMYFLGMAHLYYRSVAYSLIALIAIFTWKEITELGRYIKNTKLTWSLQPIFSFNNFLLAAIVLISGAYMAGIFQQYPQGWDALHTYAAFPKTYAENHSIVNFTYWIYSGFPQNVEMLFTLGYLAGGFQVIAGINVLFIFLIAASIYLLGCRFFDNRVPTLAVFLFLTLPLSFCFILYENKIDLGFIFYTAMAFFYLLLYFSKNRFSLFVVFSILAGIAAGIKYNFFLLFLPAFIFVIIFSNKFDLKKKITNIFFFLIIIGLLFSPWAIKNIMFSGNPLDPIAGDYLSRNDTFLKSNSISYAKSLDGILNDAKVLYENRESKNWIFYITLPFRITFNYKSSLYSEGLNPGSLFLLFVPLVILFFRKKLLDNNIRSIGIFIVTSLLLWLALTNLFLWYLYPIFPMLSLIIAAAIVNASDLRLVRAVILLFLIVFFLALLPIKIYEGLNYPPLQGKLTPTSNSLIITATFINDSATDGKIWNFNAPLNYYVKNSQERIIFDPYLSMFGSLSANKNYEEIKNDLKRLGVKYFLFEGYNGDSASYLLKCAQASKNYSPIASGMFIKNYQNFFKFRDTSLFLIKQTDDLYLYQLKDAN